MILSDRTIREQLAAGRIVIEPLDESLIQPSSIDVRIANLFRVFRNHTAGVIDVKQDLSDLTELIEIPDDGVFMLHPGEFVLGSTLERIAVPDDLVARIEGKALSLATEVPTPDGWTTIGELRVGDRVFTHTGAPTRVKDVTEVMLGRPCHEVEFSDGTVVIADAAHLWLTSTKNERRHGRDGGLRTTDEIARTLRHGREWNHQVHLSGSILYDERELPIHPYVLGTWLGDEASTKAEVTTADPVGAEHIPRAYLESSPAQRWALLEGLMDSDGHCDRRGRCEFTTVKEHLAEQVRELVASLGLRPVISKKPAMLDGVDHGPEYDVSFTSERPVFRLRHKALRQKVSGRFERFRTVRAVRPIPSVPVRCIEVEATDGIYLVTRSFIPTHNSSLGRLGLLIHSSLPASEPLLVLDEQGLALRTIGEIVKEQRPCSVVGFDPDSFEVGYHEVTGFYEGPADRIYEVRLASGRSVRVTAGHNVFTLDDGGDIRKVRTGELVAGARVAIPRRVPQPPTVRDELVVVDLVPEHARSRLTVHGPTVAALHRERSRAIAALLRDAGYRAVDYYRRRACLPWAVAVLVPGLVDRLGSDDRIGRRGERHSLPAVVPLDGELAWLLGMYVAEGYRRRNRVVISNTDQSRLDRLQLTFERLGLPVYRSAGAVTCCSGLVSDVMSWLGTGGGAPTKRVPPIAFGWSDAVLRAFLDGIVDGDGSEDSSRTSVWTTSEGLVADLLLLFARLGQRAACTRKETRNLALWQVYAPRNEHKLLTSVPLPDELLRRARVESGLGQAEAARLAGYTHASDLNNIERRCGRDAVRFATLRRLRDIYAVQGASPQTVGRLSRLVDGGLAWDRVVEVVDTGSNESIYDIEVRPDGRTVENFLAGAGGVFVSNTAGFIDAGFDGHVTLELANVASLPITLYPGMKIGQVSFMQMTTRADKPYGKGARGSKYQGQRGPTPSRYFENFSGEAPEDADGG